MRFVVIQKRISTNYRLLETSDLLLGLNHLWQMVIGLHAVDTRVNKLEFGPVLSIA
jgi:hypothetical protein